LPRKKSYTLISAVNPRNIFSPFLSLRRFNISTASFYCLPG
jgi:hypothetical protein